MKMYKADSFNVIVKEIEVVKINKHELIYLLDGKQVFDHPQEYFKTFDECKKDMISRRQEKIRYYKWKIEQEQEELKAIKQLKDK